MVTLIAYILWEWSVSIGSQTHMLWVHLSEFFVCFYLFWFFAWLLLGSMNRASRILLFLPSINLIYAGYWWIPEPMESWYFIEPIELVALVIFMAFYCQKFVHLAWFCLQYSLIALLYSTSRLLVRKFIKASNIYSK